MCAALAAEWKEFTEWLDGDKASTREDTEHDREANDIGRSCGRGIWCLSVEDIRKKCMECCQKNRPSRVNKDPVRFIPH